MFFYLILKSQTNRKHTIMENTFAKPDIYFSPVLPINSWIHYDYNQVKTMDDLISFFYKWLNDMETSDNPVRITAIKKVLFPLYSIITNKSYETKQYGSF